MNRAGDVQRVRAVRASSALLVASILSACGGNPPPPQPGDSRGFPPDLRGSRVMLLPTQIVVGVAGDPDAELAFTLRDRAREVEWVFPDEVDEVLARSPAMRASSTGLPVGLFLQAEVERVGDPLYGELRRLASLVDAEAILLPVQASFEANQAIEGSPPRVRIAMALIEPRTGRVLWYTIEEGGDFSQGDPGGLASAVEAVARALFWYIPG